MTQDLILEAGRRTIRMEAEAVAELEKRLNGDFHKACEMILQCQGRTIVTGMGKSGHIGRKIAATLASTGTPSFLSILVKPATGTWG